jgi:sugar O-acyltransferase (sialic acid O-acetyltransferase NeuD family)
MKNIVIIGSGGHANVVIDIVERQGLFRIAGLIDPCRVPGEITAGYRVLGREDQLSDLITPHQLKGCIVAVGDNDVRQKITTTIQTRCPTFPFITAIHPNSSVSRRASIGPGSVVGAGAVINPECTIGHGCILNTRCSLDHDSTMGDYSSLGPNATTGGRVCIGNGSAIGISATILQGVRIGAQTVIGGCSFVNKDINPLKLAFGIPVKEIRGRMAGEAYL